MTVPGACRIAIATAALSVVPAAPGPSHGQGVPAPAGLAAPLTAEPGDPARGRRVVRDLDKATCLICHAMPIPEDPNHGDIGPSLAGVGTRLSPAQLRQRIVDPTATNPETVMPPYYRVDGMNRVLGRYAGQTIYSAQDVEDVVAYLTTLRTP